MPPKKRHHSGDVNSILSKKPRLDIPIEDPLSPTENLEIARAIGVSEQAASNIVVDIGDEERPHRLEHPFLSRRDVYLAIASVWASQERRSPRDEIAYGPEQLFALQTFSDTEAVRGSLEPIGSGSSFLMPLMLDDDHERRMESNGAVSSGSSALKPSILDEVESSRPKTRSQTVKTETGSAISAPAAKRQKKGTKKAAVKAKSKASKPKVKTEEEEIQEIVEQSQTGTRTKRKRKTKPLTALAIARMLEGARTPQITFYCSHFQNKRLKITQTDQRRLEDAAVAMLSLWSKSPKDQNQRAQIQQPSVWRMCPDVSNGDPSTMRMALVINAWTCLWEGMSPKTSGSPRDADTPDASFYGRVRELIELAVQGRLRDSVLRRYLRAQDYLEPRRDPEDPHAKSVSLLVNPQVVGNILAQVSERKSLKVLKVLKKTEKARPLEYGLLDLLRDLEKRNKKRGEEMAKKRHGRKGKSEKEKGKAPATIIPNIQTSLYGIGRNPPLINSKNPRTPKDWADLLDAALGVQTAEWQKDQELFEELSNEHGNWLAEDDIDYAIETVWNKLWADSADDYKCAYANSYEIQSCEPRYGQILTQEDFHANRRARRFPGRRLDSLMFVLLGSLSDDNEFKRLEPSTQELNSTQYAENNSMHYVLVVAKKMERKKGEAEVEYYLLDSLGHHPEVVDRAHRIVENIGWFSTDGRGLPIASRVTRVRETFQRVPRQVGGERCGLHVVLNAWALMLGIPIAATGMTLTPEAYGELVTLYQMAYKGALNPLLIQAFMVKHGYCDANFLQAGQEVVDLAYGDVDLTRMDVDHARAAIVDEEWT